MENTKRNTKEAKMKTLQVKNKYLGWFLLTPILCVLLGGISNNLVEYANGGLMPVEVPVELLPPGTMIDAKHVTEPTNVHLKLLDDRIYADPYIESIGDIFINIGDILLFPFTIIGGSIELLRKSTS